MSESQHTPTQRCQPLIQWRRVARAGRVAAACSFAGRCAGWRTNEGESERESEGVAGLAGAEFLGGRPSWRWPALDGVRPRSSGAAADASACLHACHICHACNLYKTPARQYANRRPYARHPNPQLPRSPGSDAPARCSAHTRATITVTLTTVDQSHPVHRIAPRTLVGRVVPTKLADAQTRARHELKGSVVRGLMGLSETGCVATDHTVRSRTGRIWRWADPRYSLCAGRGKR